MVLGSILGSISNFGNSFLMKMFVLLDEPHEKIIANFSLIIIFAVIYYIIYLVQGETEGEDGEKVFYSPYSTDKITFFDALYFSFVVHFTLGFGDIFPSSIVARIAVILHTTLFWFISLVDTELVKKVTRTTGSILSKVVVPPTIGV